MPLRLRPAQTLRLRPRLWNRFRPFWAYIDKYFLLLRIRRGRRPVLYPRLRPGVHRVEDRCPGSSLMGQLWMPPEDALPLPPDTSALFAAGQWSDALPNSVGSNLDSWLSSPLDPDAAAALARQDLA